MNNTITAIPGLRVGHAHAESALTGCTVILCEGGAAAAVDVRGGAPGTRETDLLRPENTVSKVHAVLLAGGSAYGLDAAAGVMRFLEEQGVGFPVGDYVVPVVPGAILFDLGIGDGSVRPDAAMGYAACAAASDGIVIEGNAGAGMGATVGKLMGMDRAVKGGIGSAVIELGSGLLVGALFAVNAVGDVIDPETGAQIAGPRTDSPGEFANSLDLLRGALQPPAQTGGNTVIGVVATNAALSKSAAQKVARVAHDGLARTIRPAHTQMDGDTIFALATGTHEAPETPLLISSIGAFAAEAAAAAIVRGVRAARPAGGIPSISDLNPASGI